MTAVDWAQSDWLAQTKFQPPRSRKDVISRPRLLDAALDAILAHPITLLSAPAGYGKTTLVALLAQRITDPSTYPRLDERGRSQKDPLLAWLSLDENDNDPVCFLSALVASLRRAHPTLGGTAQTVISSLTNPSQEARRVVGVLVNDVVETMRGPLVLVLEDLHFVSEAEIFGALDYLIERRPPQMRVVITSRHDPPLALARLRARGQLAELRLADLRFSLDETGAFLNEKQRLGLGSADLLALHSRAEGWPAGLRLLAGSLGRITAVADRSTFVRHLAHTERYVFDFLADEVLKRQEPEVRGFLLETSILPELTPALCQAVTGRSDAALVLEELNRRNLFLVALDEIGGVYRFHALFAEFLRERLAREMPGRIAELHGRAAQAERQAAPMRAIPHYLAGQMWEGAAQTIEALGEQLLQRGLLDTLQGWIGGLSEPTREAHPWLIYFSGVCWAQRGDVEAAQPLLERARDRFAALGDEIGVGASLAELTNAVSIEGDLEAHAALSHQALAHPLSPRHRAILLLGQAWQGVFADDWPTVDRTVQEAMDVALDSGDPGAFNALAHHLYAALAFMPNGPQRLERYCRQALSRCGEGIGPIRAGAYYLLSHVCLMQGRLPESLQAGERAWDIGRHLGGLFYIDLNRAIMASWHGFISRDYAEVERILSAKLPQYEQGVGSSYLVPILYLLGRAQWLQGHIREAGQTYARMCAYQHSQEFPWAEVLRTLMQAMLEIAGRHHAAAEAILRLAVATQQRMRHTLAWGSARLILAYLYQQRNRPRDALAELAPVLAECERLRLPGLILQEGAIAEPLLRLAVQQGVCSTFAAHLLEILDGAAASKPVPVPETGETLSPREQEVLQLIAAGASNQAIAEQLVITKRTAKAHVTHILSKLHVSSRTQAIARARGLGLLRQ